MRSFAKNDPRNFLLKYQGKVIIDEVQNVPELFSYIQGIVDQNKRPAEYILTGSSQIELLEKVTQSLAGRAAIFQLLPLSKNEIDEALNGKKGHSLEESIFLGSYPRIHFDKTPATDWYSDYCRNYLERDIRKLINIKDLETFQLFLKMCAARCGQIINYSSFANDCGISPGTAKQWMNLLEASYIIFRFHPYFKNYSKRLIKAPKLYFFDTGVAASLLGLQSSDELYTHPSRGGLFESWVITEIQKNYFNQHRPAPIYFWRGGESDDG
jgi:predicted AAA+ superfamily ATPase